MDASKRMQESRKLSGLAILLKILSNETNLEIVLYLDRMESAAVQNIIKECQLVHESCLSHRLADLRLCGIIESRDFGQWVIYKLTDLGNSLIPFLDALFDGSKGEED